MPREHDAVQTAVGLSLEGLHVAVEVDHEVVPLPLAVSPAGSLDEEGFDFGLPRGGGEHHSAFGLGGGRRTLVRSLMTSSMLQGMPEAR